LGDVTGAVMDNIAGRLVMRLRDSDTQTDNVQDDRIMLAPSLTWRLGDDTNLKLISLYQQDKSGSTAQFLPLVGAILPNPNGQLDNSLFIGKPGWDRYNGALMQGSLLFDHRFNGNVKLNFKARAVDSDLTYLTHYPDNYSNPTNPFIDPAQRIMGLYADGSYARMNIFSMDHNVQLDFKTSENIEHKVLVGVDYSWNRVQKTGGFGYEFIDIYDVDYDSLLDYGGGLPPTFGVSTSDVRQEQLGVYVQDQIKFFDKISLVLGVRRDEVDTRTIGGASESSDAWSKRAGVIAEAAPGFSPFVSYTESFEPISGLNSAGAAFKPKRGKQFESGLKFHPDDMTRVTATAFHIEESNRPVDDPSTPDPFDQMQAGSLTSEGFEVEASRMLPDNYELIAAYTYVQAQIEGANVQLDDVPKTTASLWGTKSFALPQDATLRLGAGVRYVGSRKSHGFAFPDGIRTPSFTLVDALAELGWDKWRFALNATNLFDKQFYAACLARGDCFMGEAQNIYGTLTYRY
jgi:iron complex outermembrane receptor protein